MSDYLSPIEWILRQVNKPGAATAGAVLAARQGRSPIDAIIENFAGDRQDSFGDVLRNEGVTGPAASIGGFAADVVLDPLNLVPFAGLAKLTGLEKGAKALAGSRIVKPALDALGHHLDPVAGLPDDYAKVRRLLNSTLTNSKAKAVEETVKRFKGTSAAERGILSDAVETPTALNAITDPVRRGQLDAVAQTQKQAFADMASKEVAEGVLDPASVQGILGKHGGYVPYIFDDPKMLQEVIRKPVRELSGQSKFSRPRSLNSFADAKALGATDDLAVLSAKRQAAGDRAIEVNKFLDGVFANPDWAVKIPPTGFQPSQLPGWRTISTAVANPLLKAKAATYAVHPEIAGDLEKLFDQKQVSDFMRGFDKLTNMWKATATTMKPGFHLRNAVSNSFNMWLGGVSPAAMPKRYIEAAAMVAGKIPAKIGSYSGVDLVEKMKQYGVMGREFGFVGDLGDATETALAEGLKSTGRKVGEAVATLGLKPWNAAGKALGSTIEDTSKVALFLDRVRKGESAEDAALTVKKYLFDYQELTDTERTVLRRAVPFYTWLRKNIPLQIEHLYTDTDKYSKVASAYKEIEGATKEQGIQVPQEDRPNFLKKLGAVQMPFLSKSGEKEFFNPNLPFQDLGKLKLDRENLQDQLSALHPIAKAVIERSMNQSIFKDRPLYKDSSSELVDAPMSAQLFASTFPDLGKQLGIRMVKVKGEARWQMPEWASYTLDQIPVFNTLGKAAVNIGDESGTSAAPLPVPGVADSKASGMVRPPALDFFLGMKFLPQSKQQLKNEKKFQKKEAKAKQKRERTAERSTLSDEEVMRELGM